MLKLSTFPRTLGGMYCGRLLPLIVLAGLTMLTGLVPPETSAQTVDPQSLVGEWEGTRVEVGARDAQGALSMTITKVEGNQVYGRFVRDGFAKMVAPVRVDFVGTLEGSKLVFTFPVNSVELTISGTQMRGTGFESVRMEISMTKSK